MTARPSSAPSAPSEPAMPSAPSEQAAPGFGTLEELGMTQAPRDRPLLYPGVWPSRSALLDGDRLRPLDRLTHPGRTPVLAVGSNASPAQLRHKMAEFGITAPVPLTRVRVSGLAVGVSAHISLAGYVSAAPVRRPGAVTELFFTWLDAGQLEVVDASEGAHLPDGNYRRVWLPSPEVGFVLDDGTALPGAYAYVNRHGVLHDGTGAPRPHPGQRPLIAGLLAGSAPLRALFGVTPEEFCARARGDRERCRQGTRLLREEKLVTESGLERFWTPGALPHEPGR